MERLVSNPGKSFRKNPNMGIKEPYRIDEAHLSVVRGEFLKYSMFIKDVKDNLQTIKKSNPRYMDLILKIIQTSITPVSGIDINVPLGLILPQVYDASFNNQEALDFTEEVLNLTDTLTSKYYLAYLAGGVLENLNLKEQFKAAIPCIKYMYGKSTDSKDLNKQINFMNAVKILVNERADAEKIALLPKIKYIFDSIPNKNYTIDAAEIVYSKVSAQELLERITNGLQTQEII